MNKKITAWAILLEVVTTSLLVGCGEPYRESASKLSPRLYQVFIEQGLCSDNNDCQKKDIMFGGHGNRINMSIYGIKEEKVISAIFSVVINEGSSLTGNSPISIYIYKTPHSENLGLFTPKPDFQLDINK